MLSSSTTLDLMFAELARDDIGSTGLDAGVHHRVGACDRGVTIDPVGAVP